MDSIDFQHRTRFVCGPNTVDRLGELASELGGTRALVVSDPGVVSAGHFQRGVDSLTQAGVKVSSFHDVHENPTTLDVQAGLAVAQAEPHLWSPLRLDGLDTELPAEGRYFWTAAFYPAH